MKWRARKSRCARERRRVRRLARASSPVERVYRSVRRRLGASCQSTLLDLVRVVQPEVDSQRELVAVVRRLVRRGSVRLCGSFRGTRRL